MKCGFKWTIPAWIRFWGEGKGGEEKAKNKWAAPWLPTMK